MPTEDTTLLSRIINTITDPVFWITTVFFGIVVGVLGNYVTKGFESLGKSIVRRQQKLRAEEIAEATALAYEIKKDAVYRQEMLLDVLFHQNERNAAYLLLIILLIPLFAMIALAILRFPQDNLFQVSLFLLALFIAVVSCYSVVSHHNKQIRIAQYAFRNADK